MKKTLLFFSITLCFLFNLNNAQTYQLTGNPVVTTGWDLVSAATVSTDFIRLTPDQTSQFGAIKLSDPINLKYCDKWKVEFDFRIDGNGTTSYGRGDGLTFWYLSNPPTGFTSGGGLGIPSNANGLMVAFDIFNNSTEGQMSKVHLLYGTNNLPAGNPNIEYNTTANSTYHSADLNPTQPFVGANYKHVEVNGETDPNNPNNWLIHIKIDGNTITNQSFAPSGGAIGMTTGYFGFSSATGAASARQSIKNVKIFVDKVPIFTNTVTPYVCINPSTGNGAIDLTTYASQFVNNPANYTITYFVTGSGTPIANPTNFTYTGPTNITVIVSDPSATLCDNGDGRIVLNPQPFDAADATLTECNNNNAGVGIFNLDDAAVTNVPGVSKHYYPTLAALNAGTNEIMNWPAYPAANGATVFAKVITPQGCIDNAKITLNHYPVVTVNDAILRACSIQDNPSMGLFNLSSASVTLQPGTAKKFYPSLTDAINDTNEITLINNYVAPTGVVYVRVSDTNNECYGVAKITLQVIPPVYSTVLQDKVICFEAKTTLDAGSGFDGYEWSTGATTQTISGVGVGTYWVKLKSGDCWATQNVKIFPSDQPVVNYVEISNNTIIVNVTGGTPAYQYSLDNINNWHDSNEFKNIARGEYTIYVRDAYHCEPIQVVVTVPNLVNVITPNADGMNDYIDYSALGNKINLVFNVYDRYGAKIHQGDKNNQYKWDGTANGRKVPTGSYWYSVTWTENNKNRTPVKFSGWIVVKNRE